MSIKSTNIYNLLDTDFSDSEEENTKISTIVDTDNNFKDTKCLEYPSNINSNKLENDIIEQYYNKSSKPKSFKSYGFESSINYEDKFIQVNNKKKISRPYYNKFNHQNYQNHQNNKNNENNDNNVNNENNENNDNNNLPECKLKQINLDADFYSIKMDNYFQILAHHNDDKSWDYNSYFNMGTLRTWGDIGGFFKSLELTSNSSNSSNSSCSYTDFDIFVMKNEISPMWEDIENRNGSICSIKIDSLNEGFKIFKSMVYNMSNNTLLKFSPHNWNAINGISFSSKKIENSNETFCVIIKIWFRINILKYYSIDKILSEYISSMISKYSIKNKSIRPEY